MPIIRVEHNKDNPYFMLNRAACEDARLSWKALGLHTYLMSKPDNWSIQEKDLYNRHTDGTCSIRSGLKELKMCGYVASVPIRNDHGAIIEWDQVVYETPLHDLDPADEHYEDKLKTLKKQGFNYNVGNPHCSKATLSQNNNVANRTLVNNKALVSKEKKEKTLSPASRYDSVCAGGNEPSFVPKEKEKPLYDKRAKQAAAKLYEALHRKNKITRQPNLTQWTAQLEDFLLSSDVDETRFNAVLEWYCQHIGEQYVVQAFSAKAFCDHFIRIETASQRTSNRFGNKQKMTDDQKSRLSNRLKEIKEQERAVSN